MKAAARIGLRAAWAVALAGGGAAAVLLLPPVQRALLRRALARDGVSVVDLGNFHASPCGLATDRLDLARGGWRISGRDLVLRWRPGAWLRRHLLAVTELSGREIEIAQDEGAPAAGTAAAPAPPAAASPPRLAWTLDHVALAGRWKLRRGPRTLQEGDWQLRGGGFALGKAGEVAYALAWRGAGISPAAQASAQGKIRLTAGPGGDLQAELSADVLLPALAQLRPEISPLGDVHARIAATLTGSARQWTLTGAQATLSAQDPAARVHLELLQPVLLAPWRLPESELLAVRLEKVPLTWANPWLAPARFAFPSGKVDGAARFARHGETPVLTQLRLAFASGPGAASQVTIALREPLVLAGPDLAALGRPSADRDLAQIRCQDVPLGWISRWLPPGHAIAGRLAEGDSLLRTVKGRGLVLTTAQPWSLKDFRLLVGQQEFFRGDLRVAPQAQYSPDEAALQLTDIDASERGGDRLRAQFRLSRRTRDGRLAADTRLTLDLPALPHSRDTFGPLQLALAAAGRLHWDRGLGDLSHFALSAADAQGHPLVAIASDRPVRVERTPQAEWLISAADPLRFQTAALPLAWLNPYLAGNHLGLAGQLQPTALSLWLSPRHARLASTTPITVSDFRFERAGETLLDQGQVHCGASFDLELNHGLLPTLHFTYAARLALTAGRAAAGGSEVGHFATRLWFAGTEKSGALTGVAGTLWADLGALGRLPLFAGAHLPAQGELDLALSKVAGRKDAIALEARLTHLQGRDGRAAPDLAISGRARVDPGTRVGALRIKAVLQSAPRPSDAAFVLKLDNQDLAVIDANSAWDSTYVDFDAVRSFAAAFAPAPKRVAAPPARPGPPTGARPAAPAAAAIAPEPAWGDFRGKFTLEVKTLAFDGYVLEGLSGRLVLTQDTLALTELSGDIFGAHWTSALTAHFHPGDPAGDHQLSAQFALHQLDAGKVLAERFPHQAPSLDARVDLTLSVTSQADNLNDLFARTSGKFALAATGGKVRLSLPGQDMRSTIHLLGTVTFSPELRALSRLLGELSEMPLSRCQASGRLAEDGRLTLEQLHLEAPQLRLDIAGVVSDAKSPALATQPLAAHAFLAAQGDIAVILGGMGLLGRPGSDGFRPVTAPWGVTGTVGQPDWSGLYDVLARAVSGAHGTWGMLMRKLQAKIKPDSRS